MGRYKLYITNKNYSSWSLRIWLLMRAAAMPFEEVLVPIVEAERQEAFFAFSPTGKVPCLHDAGEGAGGEPVVVSESLAIAEYLAEQHGAGAVWPAEARARAWARVAAAEMATSFADVRELLSFNVGVRVALREGEAAPGTRLGREVARLQALWDEGLRRFGGPWLAGPRFGAVDAFFAPVVLRFRTFGIDTPGLPGEYCRRLLDMDPVKDWDRDALLETWREASHERDSIRGREVLADYRRTE